MDDVTEGTWSGFIEFFNASVLGAYRENPQKYAITDDSFSGRVRTSDQYFTSATQQEQLDERIDVAYTYRSLTSGEYAIAAFRPDLLKSSPRHRAMWEGFRLINPRWAAGYDERFQLWLRRFIGGDWDVENGVKAQLEETIGLINALTSDRLGRKLFKFDTNPNLTFPAGENTYRFHDSMRELDGYLVDSLQADCILAIASRTGTSDRIIRDEDGTIKTIHALKLALPSMTTARLWQTINKDLRPSRAKAAHSVREPPKPYPAVEKFTKVLVLLGHKGT
jgi:hypothetical protein